MDMYDEARANMAEAAVRSQREVDDKAKSLGTWRAVLTRNIREFVPTARAAGLKRVWAGGRRRWIVTVIVVDESNGGYDSFGGDMGIASDGTWEWIYVSSSSHGLNSRRKYYVADGPSGSPSPRLPHSELEKQIRRAFVRTLERP